MFNLVEGMVDHHILGIHHVRDDLGAPLGWDLAFLASGVVFIAVGLTLARAAETHRRRAQRQAGRPRLRALTGSARSAISSAAQEAASGIAQAVEERLRHNHRTDPRRSTRLGQQRGARPRPSSTSAVLAVRLASAIDRATASTASISAGVSSAATAAATSGGGAVLNRASASAVA